MLEFPDAVVVPHRKKRAYLGHALEDRAPRQHPYNCRILERVWQDLYLPNAALKVARGDVQIPLE